MSTLVVIDMQYSFKSASNPDVVKNVLHQIKLAKTRMAGIVLLRYIDSGPILYEISDAVDGYTRKTTVIKRDDDGSREVMKAINRKKFSSERIRVCGVNIGYCVQDTVCGLLSWPEVVVEVAKKACGPYNHDNVEGEWAGYWKNPRLIFI